MDKEYMNTAEIKSSPKFTRKDIDISDVHHRPLGRGSVDRVELTRPQLAAIPVDLAEWVCPALCGCRIVIEAKWLDGDIQPNGLSYRHPIPFTIRSLELAEVCEEHRPALQYNIAGIYEHVFVKKSSFSRSELLTARNEWGNKIQVAGYLNYPIYSPRPVDRLYTYLWRYCGNLLRPDTCGCQIYKSFDRFNPASSEKFHEHPLHSQWCDAHLFDHQSALLMNQRKNRGE